MYFPQSGLWLADYPFVNRDVFLDISLAVERGRQMQQREQNAEGQFGDAWVDDSAGQAAAAGEAAAWAIGASSSIGEQVQQVQQQGAGDVLYASYRPYVASDEEDVGPGGVGNSDGAEAGPGPHSGGAWGEAGAYPGDVWPGANGYGVAAAAAEAVSYGGWDAYGASGSSSGDVDTAGGGGFRDTMAGGASSSGRGIDVPPDGAMGLPSTSASMGAGESRGSGPGAESSSSNEHARAAWDVGGDPESASVSGYWINADGYAVPYDSPESGHGTASSSSSSDPGAWTGGSSGVDAWPAGVNGSSAGGEGQAAGRFNDEQWPQQQRRRVGGQ